MFEATSAFCGITDTVAYVQVVLQDSAPQNSLTVMGFLLDTRWVPCTLSEMNCSASDMTPPPCPNGFPCTDCLQTGGADRKTGFSYCFGICMAFLPLNSFNHPPGSPLVMTPNAQVTPLAHHCQLPMNEWLVPCPDL